VAFLATSATWLAGAESAGLATSSSDPYSVPVVVSTNPDPKIVETTLTAEPATVNIGNAVTANADTFNGSIPGPTFRLKVGDTVIVHYHNNLSVPNGIHWHGIELANEMDGTPFTQDEVPPGGSFVYRFTVNQPGIYWYHPHDIDSTNEVFRGMYGMIIVSDPNEAALQASGTLPAPTDTKPIVLSDTTVCKTAGTNPAQTYSPTQPWVGGGALPNQLGPTPKSLCETPTALDDSGNLRATSYAAGDIPSIQQNTGARTNEGQTVLTNGVNVGGRAGDPTSPGALDPGASTLDVRPGQGLRLELLNASATRYMRLRLTDPTGVLLPLVRVGGEGGLLDSAVVEGNPQPVPALTFDSRYVRGEILLAPGDRADVVAAVPSAPTSGVMTLWTEDYQRTGMGYADIPTVPVMHLNLAGQVVNPAYSISEGTTLRDATGDPVPVLGSATGTLLNPATFSPAKLGMASQNISFTDTGTTVGVNGVIGTHNTASYETAPHLGSTRYAKVGDTLELMVSNATGADHPFHLHGFSFQPLDLTKSGSPTYTWPYTEFRDTVDIPPAYTLRFRVKLTDRPMADGVTPGGALGRWMFHCHIFFHAELGMLSELVVVPDSSGKERPDVNVDAAEVHVTAGHTATVTGTYFDPNSEPVTLSSSIGSVHDDGSGTYTWTFPTGPAPSQIVYVTATDSSGLKAQIPFSLDVNDLGAPVLKLPGSKTAHSGQKLSFDISATDADPGDHITFGASGLPAGLKLSDHGNRKATVSGTVKAKPGKYTAKFTATDGKHPAVSGTVKIKITPAPELSAAVGKRIKLSGGAIKIGCAVRHKTLSSCAATVLLAGKRVGSATVRIKRKGKKSATVKVKLNARARHKIAGARHGVALKIKLVAHEFGSKTVFKTTASTTVLRQ
jgi:FtsP/CotA-like multicopper oxidase with cupredoxin domain